MEHLDDDFTSKGPAYDPLDEYQSYEDYLDNQITATDLYYLEDVELARSLVELGQVGLYKDSQKTGDSTHSRRLAGCEATARSSSGKSSTSEKRPRSRLDRPD